MTSALRPPTADEVMALLQKLLEGTALASIPKARPIAFHLDGEIWNLDPARRAAFVERGDHSTAALRMHCPPAVLARLLAEGEMWLGKGEKLSFSGDPSALQPLVEALSTPKRPLGARLQSMMSTTRKTTT